MYEKNRFRWLMLFFAVPSAVLARGAIDFCALSGLKEPTNNAITTFVFIDAFPHGQDATSSTCPRQRLSVDFAIGNDARAENFYAFLFRRPARLSGPREIQATVDYSSGNIVVKRIHKYRELTEQEAEFLSPKFSRQEDAIIQKALGDAAHAADSAANR
ncbi:hypothetical protein [Stenotrophomonas sp. SY1]|uniref:hypothetical protein n=1 Tax=Stenotrophomonas sp. SY1 TaxID=477235 RepID=UPI001E57ECBF|nr:hypothetical protein [Stenotrophomonas sp. SY1]MCD9087330.1 hypothetical protein [Stenotrophomonas sp. SY1]